MTSLFKFEVHYSAQDLKKILYYIFWLTTVFSWLREDHENLPVLPEVCTKLHSVVIDGLIVEEVHLLEDINDVDLVFGQQVALNDWLVLVVKLLNLMRVNFVDQVLLLVLEDLWLFDVQCSGWKEPIALSTAFVFAEEGVVDLSGVEAVVSALTRT